ncbi:DNA-directed RNA polymerase, subunit E'' [archaeon]|nr:DNA-directed RNA polymerase, subunit E'' [archaeon]
MVQEWACRSCKHLVPRGTERCPYCGSSDIATSYVGVAIVLNPDDSELARLLGVSESGKYGIRIQ